jgi:hypothetical protein
VRICTSKGMAAASMAGNPVRPIKALYCDHWTKIAPVGRNSNVDSCFMGF